MIRVALLALCLVSPARAQVLFNSGASDNPPAQASTAGYNTLTFSSTFPASAVDTNATYASGFQWYIANFFGYSTPNPITITPGISGAIINGSSGNAGLQIVTAALKGASWVGTAFGGGAYFEAIISFDPSLVNLSNGWPIFWSNPIEQLAALPGLQWTGQAAGYSHYAEVDIFEDDVFSASQPNNYAGVIHDWYGIQNVTCTGYCQVLGPYAGYISPSAFNWKIPHRAGFLWIPATGSSMGSATWYMDNVAYLTQTWSQYVAASDSAPPTTSTPWTFGVLDQQHMVLILGSGANQPMTVYSVRVWQASSSGNLVQ